MSESNDEFDFNIGAQRQGGHLHRRPGWGGCTEKGGVGAVDFLKIIEIGQENCGFDCLGESCLCCPGDFLCVLHDSACSLSDGSINDRSHSRVYG